MSLLTRLARLLPSPTADTTDTSEPTEETPLTKVELLDQLAEMDEGLADALAAGWGISGGAASSDGRQTDSSIHNEMTGLGNNYRDKGAAGRPNPYRVFLSRAERDMLVLTNPYAAIAVFKLAYDATREGFDVEDSTNRQNLLEPELRDLRVLDRLFELAFLAEWDGKAALLISTPDDTDETLREPLPTDYDGGIASLTVLEEEEFQPVSYQGAIDARRPAYREPLTYTLSPLSSAATESIKPGTIVHASRLLVLWGPQLPMRLKIRRGWRGVSGLERSWDAVRNMTAVEQSAATASQNLWFTLMKIKNFAALATGAEGAKGLKRRLKETVKMMGVLGIIPVDAEKESVDTKPLNLSGYNHLGESASRGIAVALDKPAVKIFGDAPSGFNSDGKSWRKRYSGDVSAFQKRRLGWIVDLVVELLMQASDAPAAEWRVKWRSIEKLDQEEEAAVELKQAQADAAYLRAGALTPAQIYEFRLKPRGWPAPAVAPEEAAEAVEATETESTTTKEEAPEVKPGEEPEVDKDIALNGAQMASLLLTIEKVAMGLIPRASGVAVLQTALNLDPAAAEAIMGEVGRTFFAPTEADNDASVVDSAPDRWERSLDALVARLPSGATVDAEARRVVRSDAQSRQRLADAVYVDASEDGVCILLPLTGAALEAYEVAAVRVRGVLPDLEKPTYAPHITLLYAGQVEDVEELTRRARAVIRSWFPIGFWLHWPHLFAPTESSNGAWPVVVCVGDAWMMEAIANELLRVCADLVTARQFPNYVPHCTVGYLQREPTDMERARLEALEMPWPEETPVLLTAAVSTGGEMVELPLAAVPSLMAG